MVDMQVFVKRRKEKKKTKFYTIQYDGIIKI